MSMLTEKRCSARCGTVCPAPLHRSECKRLKQDRCVPFCPASRSKPSFPVKTRLFLVLSYSVDIQRILVCCSVRMLVRTSDSIRSGRQNEPSGTLRRALPSRQRTTLATLRRPLPRQQAFPVASGAGPLPTPLPSTLCAKTRWKAIVGCQKNGKLFF